MIVNVVMSVSACVVTRSADVDPTTVWLKWWIMRRAPAMSLQEAADGMTAEGGVSSADSTDDDDDLTTNTES